MKTPFRFLLGGAMLALGVASAFAQNFSVSGHTIYDPNGKPFVVKGVNVTGAGSAWSNTTITDKTLIVDAWKFNAIRIYIKLFTTSSVTKQDMYNVVDNFSASHIVCIIDAHDHIGGYYSGSDLTALKSFWQEAATKYKNNPYVWFDLSNEPGSTTTDQTLWTDMYRQCIATIRDTVGANNIILVEGGAWGQDAPDRGTGDVNTANSAIVRWGNDVKTFNNKTYPNIVMSFHVYDQYKNGTSSRIEHFVDAIWNAGHALVIGEWGNYNNNDCTTAMRAMAGAIKNRAVGHLAWHWSGQDPNDLTTSGGGRTINSTTNPTNLTEFGQNVWNDTHSSDTTAPSVPTGVAAASITSSSFTLSWTASTDTGGSGLAGYYVFRNGTELGYTSSTSYNLTGLSPSTTYSMTVSAFDNASNESAQSTAKSVTTAGSTSTNLITNGTFETGALTPWTGSNAYISGVTHAGSYAGRIGTSGGAAGTIQQTITVSPSRTYTLTAWVKMSATGSSATLGVDGYGSSATASPVTGTSWVQQSITFTTSSTASSARVYFTKGTNTGQLGYIDDVTVN